MRNATRLLQIAAALCIVVLAAVLIAVFAAPKRTAEAPGRDGLSVAAERETREETPAPAPQEPSVPPEPAPIGEPEAEPAPAVTVPEELADALAAAGIEPGALTCAQLLAVESAGSEGTLRAYETADGRSWTEALAPVACWVGKNGVSAAKTEGDKMTPAGLFALGTAFGIEPKPETGLAYRSVTADSYWVDDTDSPYYNQWVEGGKGKTFRSGEHLIDCTPQYELAVVIEYNTADPVPGAGSAIFLHCGEQYTSGCVAVAHDDLVALLRWLDADKAPAILIR